MASPEDDTMEVLPVSTTENSEEDLLNQYSALIEQLQETPYQVELHLQHIQLTKQMGLADEMMEAWDMMSQYLPLSEELRLEWIGDEKEQLKAAGGGDLAAHMKLVELYRKLTQEYLSIPLLTSYSLYMLESYYLAQGLTAPTLVADPDADEDEDEVMTPSSRTAGPGDPVLQTFFNLDTIRATRDDVLAAGGLHLRESRGLWAIWRAFEHDMLKMNMSTLTTLDELYLARIATPHIGIKETFQSYSHFITTYDNAHYNEKLPIANKIFAIAEEKTIDRQPEEIKLRKAGYSASAYLDYIHWECSVKAPDVKLVGALFGRAVKDHSQSVETWEAYIEFFNKGNKLNPRTLTLVEEAAKCVPYSGAIWALYFRIAEKLGIDKVSLGIQAIDSFFSRAMSTGLLNGNVEELITIFEARAGFQRRAIDDILDNAGEEDLDEELIERLLAGLVEGIELVTAATPDGSGDPQLRLEKHLLRLYERFDRQSAARDLWKSLTTARPTSYAVWYGRADFEMRSNDFTEAHKVYSEACIVKGLDYPEYLLEAWLNFEKQNGTLPDLERAIVQIRKQKKGVENRRMREAIAAAEAAPPVASTSNAMEVDGFIDSATKGDSEAGKKRERSPAPQKPSKKAKVEVAPEVAKRDRENSTVFVTTPLVAGMTEEALRKLFSDCGKIRECKVKTIGEANMAMIEFMDKSSVGAAQTKDKKKIGGVETDVFIAWESCLYVTNFPESFDKEAVEKLFSEYGTIFEARWPSKLYKNTRRFCYVQFTSTASAQAALALHDTVVEENSRLIVYISDPEKKKGRTDAGANSKEMYVTGLSKYVKEYDLRKLFEPYGAIKGIRVVLDDKEECKGYAFVDFEEDASAQASLALNNFELKKRRLGVTIAQSRNTGVQNPHNSTKDPKFIVDGRSLTIRGIVPGTEEAIVQQALEKHAIVKFVRMTAGESDATVEFENAAEAGKILLLRDTFTIEGTPVEILSRGAQARTVDGKKPAAGPGASLVPRQASRSRGRVAVAGGRGRGGRGRGGLGSGNAPRPATSEVKVEGTTTKNQSQDDFRALLSKKAE